jgi:hypothetical protein
VGFSSMRARGSPDGWGSALTWTGRSTYCIRRSPLIPGGRLRADLVHPACEVERGFGPRCQSRAPAFGYAARPRLRSRSRSRRDAAAAP